MVRDDLRTLELCYKSLTIDAEREQQKLADLKHSTEKERENVRRQGERFRQVKQEVLSRRNSKEVRHVQGFSASHKRLVSEQKELGSRKETFVQHEKAQQLQEKKIGVLEKRKELVSKKLQHLKGALQSAKEEASIEELVLTQEAQKKLKKKGSLELGKGAQIGSDNFELKGLSRRKEDESLTIEEKEKISEKDEELIVENLVVEERSEQVLESSLDLEREQGSEHTHFSGSGDDSQSQNGGGHTAHGESTPSQPVSDSSSRYTPSNTTEGEAREIASQVGGKVSEIATWETVGGERAMSLSFTTTSGRSVDLEIVSNGKKGFAVVIFPKNNKDRHSLWRERGAILSSLRQKGLTVSKVSVLGAAT